MCAGPDLERAIVTARSFVTAHEAQPLTLDAAHEIVERAALSDSDVGQVGLEVETHLVDLASVADRVSWDRLIRVLDLIRRRVGPTALSVEPGGQVEFSGPPSPDIHTAVVGMRHTVQAARLALTDHRFGLAHVGSDPVRAPRRVNPGLRYAAMEEHFVATGQAVAGRVMMNSTAALQVNLQAGPAGTWAARVGLAHRLGPTLIAVSSSSPWLGGRDTGWKSARQRAWGELAPRECGPLPDSVDPATEWARYALRAPVVFVSTGDDQVAAVRTAVPFQDWISGAARLGNRAPTVADLQVHLTTLFPPVRLRGYLEVRYLDMSEPRWWPAVAAVLSTLMDDPIAADAAADAVEGTERLWTEAARDGLAHPALATAARRCLRIAADRAPAELSTAVTDLAELVDSGRCPGDLFAARIAEVGSLAAFEELAHA